jgi:exodeoxyribonuclease III
MTNEQAHRCDSAQNALSLGSQFNEILSLSSHCSASPRPIEEQISRAFLETRRRYLTIELPIEPEMTIRIVSLNIQQGGGKRTGPIADWLTTKTTSAVVLPEWRNNTSGQCIRKRLTSSGFQTVRAAHEISKNSLLLAAKDLTEWWEVTPSNSAKGSLILIELRQRIQLLGCYFPQRRAKAPFFQQCIHLAKKRPDVPLVMIGDFNTGRSDLDIEGGGSRFFCSDLFEALTREAGLIDLWRERHGDRREWTWCSPRNGFRIDHVFGNKAFVARFPTFRCAIDHAPRKSGLSDHSAVVLEVD